MNKSIELNSRSFEIARRLALPCAALAGVLASATAASAQELDRELQFLVDNGFFSQFFAQRCRSIGPGGDVIEGESLPVGNGRALECETDPVTHLRAINTQSSTDEPFCALVQLESIVGEALDPALSVNVVSAPDGAPWILSGTHDGGEITIGRITLSLGGTAFPLAADAHFDVIDLQPNPNLLFCPDLFGL